MRSTTGWYFITVVVSVYIDDLLNDLHNSGYGVYIGSLFAAVIAYADDTCILSCSCYGLQTLLDICSAYGQKWDIRFNPAKSQLMTFSGSNPDDTTVYLDKKNSAMVYKSEILRSLSNWWSRL